MLIFLDTRSMREKIIIVVVIDKSTYSEIDVINSITNPEPIFWFEKSIFDRNSK